MKTDIRYLFIRFAIAFLIYCNASMVEGQVNPSNFESKIDSLFANYSNGITPGAVVGIMLNDSVILTKAYGIANLEHNIPNTEQTSFHIASLTKQFTAFGISKLIDEGLLSYTDDIRKYIPELPIYEKTITIDQLLHHTSGIRSTNSLRLLQDDFYGKALTQENALSLIYAQKELNFTPDSQFGYSNSGYILLATVIEKITKKSFGEWLEENVFKPLGMNHTKVIDNYYEIIPNRAEPYQKSETNLYQHTWGSLWNDYGASGIYSTVPDILRWQRFTHTQKQLLRLSTSKLNASSNYALGVNVIKNEKNEIEEISMAGFGFGYTSFLAYFPKTKLDVVVIGNIKDPALYEKANEINSLFKTNNIKPDNNKLTQKVEVPLATLTKYAGSYTMNNTIAEFILEEGTLYAVNPAGKDALTPINETTFSIPNTPIEFIFDVEEENMIFKMPNGQILCPRIEDKNETILKNLNEYTGQFYSNELNVFINLKIEDNALILYSPKNKRIILSHSENDSFNSKDWSYHLIQFSRDVNTKIIGIKVTNTDKRVQNLKFEKK